MPHLTSLPVPEANIPTTIPAHHELPVWTDTDINCVSRIIVPPKTLLPILPEPICGSVYDDLVVAGLERNVFSRWMRGSADHAIHVGFGDELDGYRDVVFPSSKGFVIGGGDETAIFVNKGNGVYGPEMVVVFLGHFPRTSIKLNNFLVGHASEELVRRSWGRVEPNDVRDFSSCKAGYTFAIFGIPKLHLAVIGGGKEMGAEGIESGIRDGLCVSGIST